MKETEIKLRDAKTQLDLAMSAPNVYNIETVRSCINAFITNARSVTMTMQAELTASEKFKKWYAEKQNEMKANPLLKFFLDQRNITIHQKSIQPNQRTINISKVEHNGKVVGENGIALVYEFEDFEKAISGDNGNVFRNCLSYYEYLQKLVDECKGVIE